MNEIQIGLARIETELGEYKEELGANFPIFLNYHLTARLIAAQKEIAYLRKMESLV
jgi:hypothetical protein